MKNAKKIYDLGQILLVLGSVLYIVELLAYESWTMTLCICGVYAVALILMLVGWAGTRDERRARKAADKAEREAQAKKAAA